MVVASMLGSYMTYWIMPILGQTIAETTVQNVTRDGMLDLDIVLQIKAFDKALTELLDDAKLIIDNFGGFGIKYEGSDMP